MTYITIAIPTYKRDHLLSLLLQDFLHQTQRPNHLIIVDGDPDSGTVYQMLTNTMKSDLPITYVPSNYGNLSYQRYLAWRVAKDLEADILIYFDDDQRINQPDVIEWLTRPFIDKDDNIVGVGCYSRVPKHGHDSAMNHLMEHKPTHWLVKLFGSHKTLHLEPGQLAPSGHRAGLVDNGQDYITTEWLQGRIMAYRMEAISIKTFSADLFALDHIRCGLGEDTFLSRRIGIHGKLVYTFRAIVDHPNADTPKSYPYQAYKYAYAATYSRRFLNDYYRVYDTPLVFDRLMLLKSYIGNIVLAWTQVAMKPNKINFALARGKTLGAIHGLIRPPRASRLTPNIDWWRKAEEALSNSEVIRNE